MSDYYALEDPETALAWERDAPDPQVALAAKRLGKDGALNAKAAMEITARLLTHDPLVPGGLALIGLAASQIGDFPKAKKVMTLAAAQNPVDFASHSWLYNEALKSGDLVSALTEMDFLLRGRPNMIDTIGPSTIFLTGRDLKAQQGFIGILATSPPWRSALLRYFCHNTKDASALLNLFGNLNASAAPPTRDEWSNLLDRLIQDRDFGGAYVAWLASLPPERQDNITLLYNANFQYEITNLPFDWQFIPSGSSKTKIVRSGQDAELQVEFFGARAPFYDVRHTMLLEPGAYTFSGRQKAENFRSERGLWWQIVCLDGSGSVLGTTPLIHDPQTLHAFAIDFTVPASDCAAQQLMLAIQARVPDEMIASGMAVYSNLEISKKK